VRLPFIRHHLLGIPHWKFLSSPSLPLSLFRTVELRKSLTVLELEARSETALRIASEFKVFFFYFSFFFHSSVSSHSLAFSKPSCNKWPQWNTMSTRKKALITANLDPSGVDPSLTRKRNLLFKERKRIANTLFPLFVPAKDGSLRLKGLQEKMSQLLMDLNLLSHQPATAGIEIIFMGSRVFLFFFFFSLLFHFSLSTFLLFCP